MVEVFDKPMVDVCAIAIKGVFVRLLNRFMKTGNNIGKLIDFICAQLTAPGVLAEQLARRKLDHFDGVFDGCSGTA